MKPIPRLAVLFLALVALGDLLRLIFGVTVTAGGVIVPL